MRRRIERLARGRIDYERSALEFSTDRIEMEALEGGDAPGEFAIRSGSRSPARGAVYASDARMECLTPSFEGEEAVIRFMYHAGGLIEGDIGKGEFSIVSDMGEYVIPFTVSIARRCAETSIGQAKTLSDFARLYRESEGEACRLFYSEDFYGILPREGARERLLYAALRDGAKTGQKVEEFLVAAGLKERVRVDLESDTAEFSGVRAERRESVRLKKSGWGHVLIEAKSDAPFLVPEQERVSGEDFIGNGLDFYYHVRADLMHAGRNFGRITFSMPGAELRLEVCATLAGPDNEEEAALRAKMRRKEREGRVRLLSLYVDYRLRRIVTGVWARETAEVADSLAAIEPENWIYPLIKAQALIANKQRQEASWILDSFRRSCKDRDSAAYGCYLYLCTLLEKEPSLISRAVGEIERIFHRHPEDDVLFWVILFVREPYVEDGAQRLRAIGERIARGCHSPYLYLEAYYAIWQDPYLLGRMGRPEAEALYWASRQHAISKDIALQVLQVAPSLREYDPRVFAILRECYAVAPSDEMVAAICGYLMRSSRHGPESLSWYELGIEREIRLAGLYEAYLSSLSPGSVGTVPRMIQMYFQHDSHLSYQQKAALFSNIIAGKERQPEVYQKYKRAIEQFAMEQIEAMRVSDDLAVVYQDALGGIMNADVARCVSEILFTHRITCRDGRAAQIYVWHPQLAAPQVVPIASGTAYFRAYSSDYCVILSDSGGNVFAGGGDWLDEAMMHPEPYADRCMELCPYELPYLLYHYGNPEGMGELGSPDFEPVLCLLSSEQVAPEFKARLIPKILGAFAGGGCTAPQREAFGDYLKKEGVGLLPPVWKRRLIARLVEMREYSDALALAKSIGYDFLDGASRVLLLNDAITGAGYAEDPFLLGLSSATFALGRHSKVMMIYLCQHYKGTCEKMAAVWEAAGEYGIDTFDLEERILIQAMFAASSLPQAGRIYESYCARGGKEQVMSAWQTCHADRYIRLDVPMPELVERQLAERAASGKPQNDPCRVALLKHFSERESLRGEERRVAEEILSALSGEGRSFAFFKGLGRGILGKCHLQDKFFIEHRAAPGRRVVLHYRTGESDFRMEEMAESYPGVYVRAFILFYGESVQYYVTEDSNPAGGDEVESVANQELCPEGEEGRYAMLNRMLYQFTLQDGEMVKKSMIEYDRMQRLSDRAFRLLGARD